MQFDFNRNIDGAGRDVQAALNAATADLPGDLPQVPTFRKSNPSAAPILILALTSKTMTTSDIYDTADTIIGQRISQVEGVADVTVSGADQPATRMQVDPTLVASMGVSFEDVKSAVAAANDLSPIGSVDADKQAIMLDTNAQMRSGGLQAHRRQEHAERRRRAVERRRPSIKASRNTRSAALFVSRPVLLIITKTAGCQRHRHRRSGQSAAAAAQAMDTGRHRNLDPLRPHHNDPCRRRMTCSSRSG